MTEHEFLTATMQRWAADARVFVRQCLGVTPDPWQDHALALISKPETRRLALKACKGPGKTAVLAWITLWFLATRWQAKVACTSITEANIDTNLWPELSKWMQRSSFLREAFDWSRTTVLRKGDANWFAVKRTWPKSGDQQQQADALAGIHADHVLFICDESGGYPQAVMATVEAVLASGIEAKVVQSGNPTQTSGPLHRACTVDRALWEVVTITGDPDDPMRSPRIKVEWAEEQIRQYGRDNPWVMVNVLGQFPPASINALLGVEDVEAAMRRRLSNDAYDWAQKRLGIDVARFGDDRTVIFPRQGKMSWRPTILRNENTVAIAARAAQAIAKWGAHGSEVLTLIDDTGHWGHGVVDNLTTGGYPVIPVIFSDPAPNKRYKNMRAANWLAMADWVKAGGALPNMPELVPELTEITYTFLGGQFVLEPKDEVKKRLGFSPDLADALATSFAIPDMPAEMVQRLGQRSTTLHDFDPFAVPADQGRRVHDFNPFEVPV